MPILPITLLGTPVLRSRASEVTLFGPELHRLVDDMVDTMQAADGLGLAAPQVGTSLRVFVYEVDGVVGHVVNPQLHLYGEDVDFEEGCLSVPGVFGDVERPRGMVLRGQDRSGEPILLEDEGLLARVAQHETDHLDGILFLDHLSGTERRRAHKECTRAEWFGKDLRTDHLHRSPAFEDR